MAFLKDFGSQLKAITQLPSQWLQTKKSAEQAAALSAPKTTTAPQFTNQTTTTQFAKPSTSSVSFSPQPSSIPPKLSTTTQQTTVPTKPVVQSVAPQTQQPNYQDQLTALQNTAQGLQKQVDGYTAPAAPATTPYVDPYVAQRKTLQERISGFDVISPEEQAAQEQYDKQRAALEMGLNQIEDQAIAMPLITGQQASLERIGQTRLGTLEQRLARLQGGRLAQQKSAERQLGYLPKTEDKEGFSLGEGQVRYEFDPATGQYKQVGAGAERTQEEKRSASYQEYLDARKEGYEGTFSAYQTEDANRKARVAGAGLTPYQTNQSFLAISNKYQADAIVNQAVNGQTASAIADQIIANPGAATSQLASLYLLVKNLDPTSAVREGELALANQTQSYLQQFGNTLARIGEGRVIAPDAAKQLALATKQLAIAWNQTATRRQKQYQSQAETAGVGSQFGSYLGGYESGFTEQTPNTPGTEVTSGYNFDTQAALDNGWTIEEVHNYLLSHPELKK